MRIGVISDTHGVLRPEVVRFLNTCDYIIHAGDVGARDTLREVRTIAPASIVRGNVDCDSWASELPATTVVELQYISIYVVHNIHDLDVDPAAGGFDIVVCGHSHKPGIKRDNGIAFLNPGSAGPRRFNLPVSYAWIEINGSDVRMDIEELEQAL